MRFVRAVLALVASALLAAAAGCTRCASVAVLRWSSSRRPGSVFLDAGSSAVLDAAESLPWTKVRAGCAVAPVLARLGVIRLADPFGIEPSQSESRARSAAVTYRPGMWNTLCSIVRGFPTTRDDFARAPQLRADMPLVVLSAESRKGLVPPFFGAADADLQPLMQKAHRSLAERSGAAHGGSCAAATT